MGERTPLALIDGPASGRMAVAEAITNIAAAAIADISDIKLSANWMCAAGYGAEDEALFDTVRAVGMEFCPALGITIPVGKDSMSMRTTWADNGVDKAVTAPRIADRLGVRAGGGRPPVRDAAAAGRCRRGAGVAGPGPWRQPPGRFLPGPGFRAAGRHAPDMERRRPEGVLRLVQEYLQARPVAGLPRPLRRRPGGHPAGDGLCRHCGLRWTWARSAGASRWPGFVQRGRGGICGVRGVDLAALRAQAAALGLGDCLHDLGRRLLATRWGRCAAGAAQ